MPDDPTRASEGGPAEEDAPTFDPGVDAHIFATEWAAAWEDVPDEPAESLPVLDDIIGRMLVTAGYSIDDAVERQGEERELLDRYRAVHDALEADELDGDSPGDVADAINALTDVYEALSAALLGPVEAPEE
jgi:hypothetical protein